MFFPEGNLHIWLCTAPTDMRKSYNGLSALVKNHLHDNPLNGNLYVFINRKGDQMKILFFDRNGYSIWGKRLEQGQFVVRHCEEKKVTLSYTQLQCLLDGIEWRDAKQYKRFSLTQSQCGRL